MWMQFSPGQSTSFRFSSALVSSVWSDHYISVRFAHVLQCFVTQAASLSLFLFLNWCSIATHPAIIVPAHIFSSRSLAPSARLFCSVLTSCQHSSIWLQSIPHRLWDIYLPSIWGCKTLLSGQQVCRGWSESSLSLEKQISWKRNILVKVIGFQTCFFLSTRVVFIKAYKCWMENNSIWFSSLTKRGFKTVSVEKFPEVSRANGNFSQWFLTVYWYSAGNSGLYA